jgi:hypothetical protein
MSGIRRREFIAVVGGALAWPLAARAQQGERMRRIGVLMNASSDDADGQARIVAFVQALQELGWTDRRNARIDVRAHCTSRRLPFELCPPEPRPPIEPSVRSVGARPQEGRDWRASPPWTG